MEPETQKIIAEQMKIIPSDVRAAIIAPDYQNKIREIADKHNLPIEEAAKLEMETTLVMIGLEPLADYPVNLEKELGLSEIQANEITLDVGEAIFRPVESSLEAMNEPEPEETPAQNIKINKDYDQHETVSSKLTPEEMAETDSVLSILKKRQLEEQTAREQAEAEAKRLASLEAQSRTEMEIIRRLDVTHAAREQAEAEAKKQADLENKLKAETLIIQKQQEERRIAKEKAEADAKLQAELETKAKVDLEVIKKMQNEASLARQQAEAEMRKQGEMEARTKAEVETIKRKLEADRLVQEKLAAQKRAEEEVKLKAKLEEEEKARQEDLLKKQAELEAKAKLQLEEMKRRQEEEEKLIKERAAVEMQQQVEEETKKKSNIEQAQSPTSVPPPTPPEEVFTKGTYEDFDDPEEEVTMFTNSNEPTLNRDQILKEIENPSLINEGSNVMRFSPKSEPVKTAPLKSEPLNLPQKNTPEIKPITVGKSKIPNRDNESAADLLRTRMNDTTMVSQQVIDVEPDKEPSTPKVTTSVSGVDPYREVLE